jgi:hypothetical protein
MPPTLRRLTLHGGQSLPLDEVRHLERLSAPQLEWLAVDRIFAEPLTQATVDRLRPGNETFDRARWPKLQTFCYSHQ